MGIVNEELSNLKAIIKTHEDTQGVIEEQKRTIIDLTEALEDANEAITRMSNEPKEEVKNIDEEASPDET